MTDLNTIKEFTEALRATESGTKPYDTYAEVIRVEGSTAWVHIPGGVDETPVQLTIDAKAGDSVNVRVSGGRAWITGNGSRPPTDDTRANAAHHTANVAQMTAEEAQETAEAAQAAAQATRNYFWHDGQGAHVATVEGDATTGKNVLIDSDGMEVRDGTNVLAEYSADGMSIYSRNNKSASFTASRASIGQTPKVDPYDNYMSSLDISKDSHITSVIQADYYCDEPEHEIEIRYDTETGEEIGFIDVQTGDFWTSKSDYDKWFAETYYEYTDHRHDLRIYQGDYISYHDQWESMEEDTKEADLRIRLFTNNESLYINDAKAIDSNGIAMRVHADESGRNIIDTYLPITNGVITNLDNATQTGFYSYSSSATNAPVSANGTLLVVRTSSTYQYQVAFSNNSAGNPAIYTRIHRSEGWGAWKSLSYS